MSGYRDLIVYQRACELADQIHTFVFVPRRAPNLPRQVKRSADAIAANIAEGYDKTPAQKANHIRIAIAESVETEHHLETALRRGAIKVGNVTSSQALNIEVRKMLYGYMRYVQRKI